MTLAGRRWPSLWILAVGPAPASTLLLVPRRSVIGTFSQVPTQDQGGRAALGVSSVFLEKRYCSKLGQPAYPSAPKKFQLESEEVVSKG